MIMATTPTDMTTSGCLINWFRSTGSIAIAIVVEPTK
jgi:hypothetical protein